MVARLHNAPLVKVIRQDHLLVLGNRSLAHRSLLLCLVPVPPLPEYDTENTEYVQADRIKISPIVWTNILTIWCHA